jgi:hypothetical protein
MRAGGIRLILVASALVAKSLKDRGNKRADLNTVSPAGAFSPVPGNTFGGLGMLPPAEFFQFVEDDGDITLYFSKPVHFGGK